MGAWSHCEATRGRQSGRAGNKQRGIWMFLSRERLGQPRSSRLRKKCQRQSAQQRLKSHLMLGGKQRWPHFHTHRELPQKKDTLHFCHLFDMKAFFVRGDLRCEGGSFPAWVCCILRKLFQGTEDIAYRLFVQLCFY